MDEYIGLDVSMKETAISVRRAGKRVWRGKCASDPQLLAAVNRSGIVHHAHRRLLYRDIQTCELRHRYHSFPRCTRSGSTPTRASYVKGLQLCLR